MLMLAVSFPAHVLRVVSGFPAMLLSRRKYTFNGALLCAGKRNLQIPSVIEYPLVADFS